MIWVWWMLRVALWALVFFLSGGLLALDRTSWLLWGAVGALAAWELAETAQNSPGTIQSHVGPEGHGHG